MSEDRTEQPTQRQRQRFRERGQVAYSRDLTAAAGFLGCFLVLRLAGPWMLHVLERETVTFAVSASAHAVNDRTIVAYDRAALWLFARLAGPTLFGGMAGALLAGFLQTGGLLSVYPLTPSADKINPANGFKRLFSWQGLFDTGKSLLVTTVLLSLAWATVEPRWMALTVPGLAPVQTTLHTTLSLATLVAARCTIAMLVVGAADFAFQWWQSERRMRMTRQELRDELRDIEGDPTLQMRRRRRRRELLEQRITPEMRQATAVVTNPTHLAVALSYRVHAMSAPKVVAKGRGPVAKRIVALARTYDIPVSENVALARALYKTVPVGEHIPRALYQVVAEFLALVYRRKTERIERQRRRRRRDAAA